jgi:hypothetical protein
VKREEAEDVGEETPGAGDSIMDESEEEEEEVGGMLEGDD